MTRIIPYLTFNGDCEAAMNFYKSIFGGEFSDFNTFGSMPSEDNQIPEDRLNKIMHISYPINEHTTLMASDAHPMYPPIRIGDQISLSIATESKIEADRIFVELSTGGEITMPISDTFWGAYFGMLRDKFGIIWMVNYDYPKS